jgi:polyadenylate-binding protein
MHGMNGALVGSKQLVVRLHEPKQLRQEKLAARFAGHNGHPRSASGATSPTLSEGGESYLGWPSPGAKSAILGSPVSHSERLERPRRGSGSYYNVIHYPFIQSLYSDSCQQAALAGTLNLPMRYDDLSALSPVVRKEVLTGELSRRLKSMPTIPSTEVDGIVESLVGLSLSDVVSAIQDPTRLDEHIQRARNALPTSAVTPPEKAPSPANSQDSRLLDTNALNATASAPEHPSTPISVAASLSTPPRTSSPSGSVAPATASERERILAAVTRLEPERATDLTDLLMSLPKRERAMCLFNVEVLRAKLVDAKVVLDSDDAADGPTANTAPQATPEPVTPQSKRPVPASQESSPQTPDLSSRGASAAASPTPATPGTTHTVASLARLPATEIIKIANSPSTTGLPLPKADPLVIEATDQFSDSLLDKPVNTRKQLVGEKL